MIHPRSTALTEHADGDKSDAWPGRGLLLSVLEALPVGIGLFEILGDAFCFRAGNREFGRLLGLRKLPNSGQRLADIFSGADAESIRELFAGVRASHEPQSYFTAEDRADGTSRIWNLDAYPVVAGGRLSHIMVLAELSEGKFDVRQRQQLERDRLRQKADQLAELERAKSEFLRLASHELRGPAAMLGGYISMMEDEALGPIPARMRPVLPILKAKAAQINMLANEMVEAARLEDRRLQLKRRRIDLRETLRRNLDITATGLADKHPLFFDDRIKAPVMVQADDMRLDIIISNLIDNAIKYSPEGGDIIVQLSTSGDLAFISVRDFGIGIAAEDLDKLFIRFSRIAPRPDVPGTGLGLYLARELARLHGGDIVAVSKQGEGSEFTLSLPREPVKR
ncbi:MAG TPA: HAMP domain-containing sensor histidine kinase [Candidatus Acidoferrum sp.]|nr:HAMP domain-containing sensor histidine kinase [Candidatus Acidoferrum sp.]